MSIYLDSAATAKLKNVDSIIIETIMGAMETLWMNPSSLYAENVKSEIDKCRINIAKFINAKPEEIIFTSGASESNNLAIRGWVDYMLVNSSYFPNIITTQIEHKSILELVKNKSLGAHVFRCNVDEFGFVDDESLEHLLSMCEEEPILVSVCMANNEIGTCQCINYISNVVHKYNGILHVDATQAFGHIPINVEDLGIDMMSVSGHKISPVLRGIGFLYKKSDINIYPLIHGTQENGLRGGTENTYGIIGLNKAIELCDISCEKIEELIDKRNYFINQLVSKFGCKLNGHYDYRLPNNINVTFPQNMTGESLLYMLEMSNIFIGTGSACNSYTNVPSHVLKAIGLTDEEVMKSIRISLAEDITYEDIDKVIKEIDNSLKIIELEL